MTRRALLWVCTCTVLLPLRHPAAQTPQDQLAPEQLLLSERTRTRRMPTIEWFLVGELRMHTNAIGRFRSSN
jgi:hypothetical protein